ncbi:MAG TPA: hypothetical protein VF810_01685 [Patescibacteria group bacterium]
MSKVAVFMHGVYPRSRELAQASRDFDRKRITLEELKKLQESDFKKLQENQEKANFDYLEDGKLIWQDIFRPIVEATSGMEVGSLTRWFDNNSFYRQPMITGKLKFNPQKLDGFFKKLPVANWKVTLPSPFTFAKVTDDTTSVSFEKTLAEITEIMIKIVEHLVAKKVKFVQFNEPFIPYYQIKKSEVALLGKALSQFKRVKGDTLLAVQGYFGDTSVLVNTLAGNSALDALGVDFLKTPLQSLPKKLPQAIIAGVLDGRNSLLEEKDVIKDFAEKIIKYFDTKILYLSNNSDLDLLPEAVASAKIKLLGQIRKELQK